MSAPDERLASRALDVFEVVLVAPATAGYLWTLRNRPQEIEEVASETRQVPGEPSVGGPIEQVFRFRASQPGTYLITFELVRPWIGHAEAKRTFLVEVRPSE